MRATGKLLIGCIVLWAGSFSIRHAFLADIVPIADDQGRQSTLALEAAFLLVTLENIALFGAAILAVMTIASWGRACARAFE